MTDRRIHHGQRLRAPAAILLLASAAIVPAAAVRAATLTVGLGQQYLTIAAAVAAARDGDTLAVQAGIYVNDFAEISRKLTLQAVGGRVQLKATGLIPNRKAILITDTDVTITGFEFSGARISDADGANGAGIRYQGGKLVLNNCYFYANQEGMLAAASANGTITINASEFYHNGAATGPSAGYTHNLYVNQVARLDIENSYFHDAVIGHEIKSRALTTIVNQTRVVESATGTASYSIDLPNGGAASLTNNQIEQGPRSGNPVIVAFGEEGGVYAGSGVTMTGNLIVNLLSSPSVLGLWNASSVTASVAGNQVFGLSNSQLEAGPARLSANTFLAVAPVIPTNHPWSPAKRGSVQE